MTSLKAASDMAQAMVDLRDTAAFQAKAVEFQRTISDALGRAIVAQQERATLLETVDELKKEVADLKAWEAQKQRYEMKDAGNGVIAYAVKEEARGSEPPHWICADCYEDAKESVLQPEIRFPGRTHHLVCIAARLISSFRADGCPPSRDLGDESLFMAVVRGTDFELTHYLRGQCLTGSFGGSFSPYT
jgi:hypothetical protein